jgi:GxxExxY protein
MDEELERIARDTVDCSMKIHMDLGPGLLESVYTVILQKKLRDRGYRVKREVPIALEYEGVKFELGFRADLIVNDRFIIELKSVEKSMPVHAKQREKSINVDRLIAVQQRETEIGQDFRCQCLR